MSTRTRTAALVTLGLSLSSSAFAEENNVELGGVIYGHFGTYLNDMTSEFDIDRVYLTAKSNIGDSLAIRVTTDMGRESTQTINIPHQGGSLPIEVSEDTKIRVFLKYAYLEWKEALPGVKLRFGMAQTPWTSQYDKFWGHRWVQKSFADKHGVLSTSDIGVHALGSLSEGMVSWQAAVLNGTGYGAPETDASKTAQLRVTVNPMASSGGKLPISGFVSYDPVDLGWEGDAGITYAAGTGYKIDAGMLWAEYLGRSQGDVTSSGYSVSAVAHMGDFGHAVARYDSWDSNTDADGDAENSALIGLAHNYAEQVSMGLFYEHTLPDGDGDAGQSVFVRMQAGF